MTYRDDFIESEKAIAAKRAEDIIFRLEYLWVTYGGIWHDLLESMLTTPIGVLHHAFGWAASNDYPLRQNKSDDFPDSLFSYYLGHYDAIQKLDFAIHYIGYGLIDDGDFAVAYYREDRNEDDLSPYSVVRPCEGSDLGAIPFITQSAEIWEKVSGKKVSRDIVDNVGCLKFWLERERHNVELMMEFDSDDGLTVDGHDFDWHLAQSIGTPDVVFGRQLIADFKERHGE